MSAAISMWKNNENTHDMMRYDGADIATIKTKINQAHALIVNYCEYDVLKFFEWSEY